MVASTAVTAMPFTAPLSASVKFVTSAETSVPGLLPSATSSAIVVSVLAAATGASFTGFTVTTKLAVVPALFASVTVTVIVLVPLTSPIGVSVIVRFAPLPPRLMPPAATTPTFEEVAVTVSEPAAVSTSPTVNAIGEVGVSSVVLCAEIVEIVLHVALNTLTNYVNEVAETTIDFPAVKARDAA